VLLDFGAVATLSTALREGIPQLIEAAIRNDTVAMVDTFNKMGFLTQGRDAEKMAEKMLHAVRNFLQNEVQIEGLDFKNIKVDPFNNSLLSLIQEIGLSGVASTVQVPKDYVLLSRMMTLLLGLSTTLDPTLNPLDIVRPYAKEYMLKNESTFSFVNSFLRRTVTTALGLPEELSQVLQRAKKGDLDLNTPDVRDGSRLLYAVGQQLIVTLLLIASVFLSFLFHQNSEAQYARITFCVSCFFAFLLFQMMRKRQKY
jgi:predicted unusual protein kinase regulating ubiquinone biosynthesis (AarF/ABC1/UbiB family)